jgi:hypothetical protein
MNKWDTKVQQQCAMVGNSILLPSSFGGRFAFLANKTIGLADNFGYIHELR